MLLFVTSLVFSLSACSSPSVDCSVFPHQEEALYILPFEAGTSYKVYATTEHYRSSSGGVGVYAIDFVMPIGTTIVAAREGVVVSVRQSFVDWNNVDLEENYVFIPIRLAKRSLSGCPERSVARLLSDGLAEAK